MTGGGFIFSELSKSSGFVAIGRTVYFSAVTLHESKVSSNMHGLSSPPPPLKAHIPKRWSLTEESERMHSIRSNSKLPSYLKSEMDDS